MSSVKHGIAQYEINRAEVSHETTRQREQQMHRFKSAGQAQRFLAVDGVVGNLFNLGLPSAVDASNSQSRVSLEAIL